MLLPCLSALLLPSSHVLSLNRPAPLMQDGLNDMVVTIAKVQSVPRLRSKNGLELPKQQGSKAARQHPGYGLAWLSLDGAGRGHCLAENTLGT